MGSWWEMVGVGESGRDLQCPLERLGSDHQRPLSCCSCLSVVRPHQKQKGQKGQCCCQSLRGDVTQRGESRPTPPRGLGATGPWDKEIPSQECSLSFCLGPECRVQTSERRGRSQVSPLFLAGEPHPQQARKRTLTEALHQEHMGANVPPLLKLSASGFGFTDGVSFSAALDKQPPKGPAAVTAHSLSLAVPPRTVPAPHSAVPQPQPHSAPGQGRVTARPSGALGGHIRPPQPQARGSCSPPFPKCPGFQNIQTGGGRGRGWFPSRSHPAKLVLPPFRKNSACF